MSVMLESTHFSKVPSSPHPTPPDPHPCVRQSIGFHLHQQTSAACLKVADVKAFSADEITFIDQHMKSIRCKEQRQLESFLSPRQASSACRDLAHQIFRLALNKGASEVFKPKTKARPMDLPRLEAATVTWKRCITKTFSPPADSLWHFTDPELEDKEEQTEKVYTETIDASTHLIDAIPSFIKN